MSTRSVIALATDTGVAAIYCHHDGYVEHNGRILQEHYTSANQVRELIAQGDMSVLAETPKKSIFYARDRKEPAEYTRARVYSDYQSMLEGEFENSGREFVYVMMKNGEWSVINVRTAETEGACKLSDKIAELNRAQIKVV